MASPVNSISSDRFCAIQLPLTQHVATESCLLTIICVYLPSSDHSLDEFSNYLSELECAIGTLKSSGPVMLVGDFNAHLQIHQMTLSLGINKVNYSQTLSKTTVILWHLLRIQVSQMVQATYSFMVLTEPQLIISSLMLHLHHLCASAVCTVTIL